MPALTRRMSTSPSHLAAQDAGCETVQEMIDIAVTAEAFAVTLLGEAIASAERGELSLNDEEIMTLVAARAAEQAHYDVLTEAGAQPLTETFTVPDPELLTNTPLFLETLVSLEKALFGSVGEAAAMLEELGFIGGDGAEITYPGPGEIDTTGVDNLTP